MRLGSRQGDKEELILTDGTISARQTTIKDQDTSDIYIENMSTTTTITTVPDEVFVTINLVGVRKSMEFKLDTDTET